MPKTLFITVGGSHQPVVTSIETLKPDYTVFVCSTGSIEQVVGGGKPCEVRQGADVVERLPNIPTQLGLDASAYDTIEIDDPDNLSESYRKIAEMMRTRQADSDVRLLADYTGATKTMSAALAMAALDYGAIPYVTTRTRVNIVKVERGERTNRAAVSEAVTERVLERTLPQLLENYNYASITKQLGVLSATHEISTEQRRKIDTIADCAKGFDAWDKFDHREAWSYLSDYMKLAWVRERGVFLRRVLASRAKVDEDFSGEGGTLGHGYELVEDLLLNAERRAAQKRYDDAVGRLYRALELLAQIRLLDGYEIRSGAVDVATLPDTIRGEYAGRDSDARLALGLSESYTLLSKLADPLGAHYKEHKNRINDVLKVRNYSLFAHGFKPITRDDYNRCRDIFKAFIEEGIATIVKDYQPMQTQFPKEMPLS